MIAKRGYIIALLMPLLIIGGCLSNDSNEANELINNANQSIKRYTQIENNEIIPLKTKIDKNESSINGAKRSVELTKIILSKNNKQSKLLNKAKKDMAAINQLSVSDEFKKYAKLTCKGLEIDIETTNIATKLYRQLQTMNELIIINKLTPAKYSKIDIQINHLTKKAADLAQQQKLIQMEKEDYYKNVVIKN